MMRNLLVLTLTFLAIFSGRSFAQEQSSALFSNLGANKDRLVGNIVKQALEEYHFRKLKIDDDLSRKAFDEYIKKVDFSKTFLLKDDVKKLSEFKVQMDDQLISGDHKLVKETVEIMKKRISQAEGFQKEFFKKGFDFTENETLELDPEKREFVSSEKELKELWRKTLKNATLARYLSSKEHQEEEVKAFEENKTKKGKEKKDLKKPEVLSDADLQKKAFEKVSEKYVKFFERLKEENNDDFMEKFVNSISGIFDPHTVYMPPRRKEDFDIDISGKLEGIGAVLQEDGSFIKVVKIVPGGAAWKQKDLEVDDVILMVGEGDGEPVDIVDMRVDDAVRYIRGKKGTTVKLTVKKPDGSRKVIPIERDVVKIEASFAKSSVIQHKDLGIRVGYIFLPKFYRDFGDNNERNCTEDVRRELEALKKEKVDAMILDLRNNGGGALEDARRMSGLFIDKGPIVQIKNHMNNIEVMEDTDPSVTYDGPLVVMVNRFSASASEILAGAMQDYKRAVIVGGEYTHGKGTVQAVLPLNPNPVFKMLGNSLGALKVTIQKFYRITGDSTQFKGVTPDIALPDQYGYTKSREQDLDYALPWDKVRKLNYTPWNKFSYDVDRLRKRSEKRVKNSDRLKMVSGYVEYLTKRRDDTKITLNMKELIKEDEENEKITKSFHLDDENKKIEVSAYERSLKTNLEIAEKDKKQWEEDFKARKEEWISGLRKDHMLEETLYIIDDIIRMNKGQNLSMVK